MLIVEREVVYFLYIIYNESCQIFNLYTRNLVSRENDADEVFEVRSSIVPI